MNTFCKISILVCTHTQLGLKNKSCGGSLSQSLVEKLKQQIAEKELDISVREQVCFGRCEEGIVARIYPGKEFFMQVTEASLPEIIAKANSYVETGE